MLVPIPNMTVGDLKKYLRHYDDKAIVHIAETRSSNLLEATSPTNSINQAGKLFKLASIDYSYEIAQQGNESLPPELYNQRVTLYIKD